MLTLFCSHFLLHKQTHTIGLCNRKTFSVGFPQVVSPSRAKRTVALRNLTFWYISRATQLNPSPFTLPSFCSIFLVRLSVWRMTHHPHRRDLIKVRNRIFGVFVVISVCWKFYLHSFFYNFPMIFRLQY